MASDVAGGAHQAHRTAFRAALATLNIAGNMSPWFRSIPGLADLWPHRTAPCGLWLQVLPHAPSESTRDGRALFTQLRAVTGHPGQLYHTGLPDGRMDPAEVAPAGPLA